MVEIILLSQAAANDHITAYKFKNLKKKIKFREKIKILFAAFISSRKKLDLCYIDVQ